jgi:hypothetical protein
MGSGAIHNARGSPAVSRHPAGLFHVLRLLGCVWTERERRNPDEALTFGTQEPRLSGRSKRVLRAAQFKDLFRQQDVSYK